MSRRKCVNTLNPIITPHPAVEAVEAMQESSPLSPLSPLLKQNSNEGEDNATITTGTITTLIGGEHQHHHNVKNHSEPIDVLSPKLMSQALNFKDSVDFVVPEEDEESKNQK